MMRGLAGCVVLVTGGASGIGRATAERLVEEGARVALVDRDAERLAETVRALGKGAAAIAGYVGDVADAAFVDEAVGQTAQVLGNLSGVVTAAGIFDPADMAPIADADPHVFARVLAVNLTGTFLVIRAALPQLVRAGGAVVTVASTAGLRGHGFGAAYTASKGGVVAFTRLVAEQYGPQRVRANCVCPGFVATPMNREVHDDPAFLGRIRKSTPLGRIGQAGELAAAICHLLSDDASYTTGQVIAVDGGATAR
jgi:NAD(P)-dependent dehydrogenase (short-subunit alcohol dehydrogenase family)